MQNPKRTMQNMLTLITFIALYTLHITQAFATPTTHIWSPSTDVQPYGVGHVTADAYVPTEKDSQDARPNTVTNFGLTFGLLPFDKIQAEAGFDHIAGYGALDSYPIYFNWKLGTPEDAWFKNSPALAVGEYMIGTKSNKTDNDIFYFKAAKTFSIKDFSLGRFSTGYFQGKSSLLLHGDKKDYRGPMFCWERTMTEISDKLWVAVDYQGTKSGYGALNFGASWKFSPNVSVIVGYDRMNNRDLADTITIQCDIDFDVFPKLFKKGK